MPDYAHIHLVQFCHQRFAAVDGESRTGVIRWLVPYGWMELFEAMSWLAEGALCGYFSRTGSEAVWNQFSLKVRQNLSDYWKFGIEFVAPRIVDELSARTEGTISFEMSDPNTWSKSHRLEAHFFGHALLLSNRLAGDVLACRTAAALLFLEEGTWQQVLSEGASPSDIADALDKPDATMGIISQPVLLAGFVRLLEHMAASRELFDLVREAYSTEDANFVSFRQRVGMISSGRLPLSVPLYNERFEHLVSGFEDSLRPELRQYFQAGHWYELTTGFRAYVAALKRHWSDDHPLFLYAMA